MHVPIGWTPLPQSSRFSPIRSSPTRYVLPILRRAPEPYLLVDADGGDPRDADVQRTGWRLFICAHPCAQTGSFALQESETASAYRPDARSQPGVYPVLYKPKRPPTSDRRPALDAGRNRRIRLTARPVPPQARDASACPTIRSGHGIRSCGPGPRTKWRCRTTGDRLRRWLRHPMERQRGSARIRHLMQPSSCAGPCASGAASVSSVGLTHIGVHIYATPLASWPVVATAIPPAPPPPAFPAI